jgi:hypothetical protein
VGFSSCPQQLRRVDISDGTDAIFSDGSDKKYVLDLIPACIYFLPVGGTRLIRRLAAVVSGNSAIGLHEEEFVFHHCPTDWVSLVWEWILGRHIKLRPEAAASHGIVPNIYHSKKGSKQIMTERNERRSLRLPFMMSKVILNSVRFLLAAGLLA